MKDTDYYDFEKSKARSGSVKEGQIVKGFEVTCVIVSEGIILVDAECKNCSQALRLFEALAYGDLCGNCLDHPICYEDIVEHLEI